MNYRLLGKILGKIMIIEAILMLAPFAVSIIYKESFNNTLAFIVPIILLSALGTLLQFAKLSRTSL